MRLSHVMSMLTAQIPLAVLSATVKLDLWGMAITALVYKIICMHVTIFSRTLLEASSHAYQLLESGANCVDFSIYVYVCVIREF